MGAAYFYHLTDSSLDVTLPMLVSKARDAGWRVLIRGIDPALLERLDANLWGGDNASFLPHGMAGGPHDAEQPVLIGSPDISSEGFECVMSVGGAEISSQEVGLSQRCCVLFDGHDAAALDLARSHWKSLSDQGCRAQYWAQDDGRWVKKAETTLNA